MIAHPQHTHTHIEIQSEREQDREREKVFDFWPNRPIVHRSNVIGVAIFPQMIFYSLVVWYFSRAYTKYQFHVSRPLFLSLFRAVQGKKNCPRFHLTHQIRGCFFFEKIMFKYDPLCIWTVVAVCVGVCSTCSIKTQMNTIDDKLSSSVLFNSFIPVSERSTMARKKIH